MMPSSVAVSVITPAHNAAPYIRESLRSVMAQEEVDFEVIVVDDGSTDETQSVIREFATKDPRVQLICQPNSGVAAARNRAIAAARGSLIAPLDSDDVWHPTYLAKLVGALHGSSGTVGLAYAWSESIDSAGRPMPATRARANRFPTYQSSAETVPHLLLSNFVGNASSVVMRRSVVLAAGGYDPSLRARRAEGCEDHKLYLAIALDHDFVVVPEVLVGYRRHPKSMSAERLRMVRSHVLFLDDMRPQLHELPANWWGASEYTGFKLAVEVWLKACLLFRIKQMFEATKLVSLSRPRSLSRAAQLALFTLLMGRICRERVQRVLPSVIRARQL